MKDPAVKHLVDVLVDDMRTRVSGGLERFITSLAIEGGRKDYEEWARSPQTQVFLGALKSLADTLPLAEASDHAGLAKAFGCMSGINLAIKLIEDPTRVFPSVYDGAGILMSREPGKAVDETYDTPPEGEVDDTKGK